MINVAVVTITYNDDYKFDEWCEHYSDYKDDLSVHIIVDNGSNDNYLKRVKGFFKDSIIIEKEVNGGCTGAYNDGIKYALTESNVDAIMLLANDIKLSNKAIDDLGQYFSLDKSLGMISPILLNGWSNVVSDFGCQISYLLMMRPYCDGSNFKDIRKKIHYCEALTGGVNIATREFYEKVGLQDDNLFMYSDEVDMGIRARKNGFKMASVSSSKSWHEHINKQGKSRREPFTKYLAGRNKVYLANKHFGLIRALASYLFVSFAAAYKLIQCFVSGRFSYSIEYLYMLRGALMGLLGKMETNKFSLPKGEFNLQSKKEFSAKKQ